MNNYYVYNHYDNDGNLFYVGIGSTKTGSGKHIGYDRATENHSKHQVYYRNYILNNNLKHPSIYNGMCKIISSGLTFSDACDIETLIIKRYGRLELDVDGILVNRAIDGKHVGRGAKGVKKSPRTKEHIDSIMIAKERKNYLIISSKEVKGYKYILNNIKINNNKLRLDISRTIKELNKELKLKKKIERNKKKEPITQEQYTKVCLTGIGYITKEEHSRRTSEAMKRYYEEKKRTSYIYQLDTQLS